MTDEERRENKRKSAALYYLKNKEKILLRSKEYASNNKDAVAKYKRDYLERNVEKEKLRQKARCKNNPKQTYSEQLCKNRAYRKTPAGKAAAKNSRHKRRSIKKEGDVTIKQMIDLQENANVCYWCSVSLKSAEVHIDHYIPLAKGGEHTISNLVVTCSTCNLKKNVKDPYDFALQVGKLF